MINDFRIYSNLILFYSITIELGCAFEKRFPNCVTTMKFIESQGLNDMDEHVNGWIAYVRPECTLDSLLPHQRDVITSSQGSSQGYQGGQTKLPSLYVPVFPPHDHDGTKEEFKRGLPKEVIKIAQQVFDEQNGNITARKLRTSVSFLCSTCIPYSYFVPTVAYYVH